MPNSNRGFIYFLLIFVIALVIAGGFLLIRKNHSVLGVKKQQPLKEQPCTSNEQCNGGQICSQPIFCPILKRCQKSPKSLYCRMQQALCNGTCIDNPNPTPTPTPLPFVTGVNIRGAIHYGYNDLLPYSLSSTVDADLSEVKKIGGKVVRVFVGNKLVSHEETARRLDEFLTKAEAYEIQVIPSLIDFYDSGFSPKGTEQFYKTPYSGTSLLDRSFFDEGYKDAYLKFVDTVVERNKNHPNIFAWEPGNELKYDPEPELFVNFMQDVTRKTKEIDPNHKISTGMISAAHTALTPDQLYPRLADIDRV